MAKLVKQLLYKIRACAYTHSMHVEDPWALHVS